MNEEKKESAIDEEVKRSDDIDDFVIPHESYKKHNSRRSRHKRHAHREEKRRQSASGDRQSDVDDYVYATPKRRKRRRSRRKKALKIVIIIVSALLALVLAAGVTFVVLREIGRRSMHDYSEIDIVIPTDDGTATPDEANPPLDDVSIIDNGKIVQYEGKTYTLNEEIAAITFIGVDDSEINGEMRAMSDAIYLMAIDQKNKKVTILGVSRDTMADVNEYSTAGRFIDTEKMQISYAYSYGNDSVSGGENTNTAVSRLFFGLPLRNYFAINMDALKELNDAVGGVTLTSSMSFYSQIDGRMINKGDTVTLFGKDAEYYVRTRDMEKLDSNNDRMQRQQEYINAFLSQLIPAAKRDPSVISKLYNTIKVNSSTSLSVPKITYLAGTAIEIAPDASTIEYRRLDGEIKAGEHAEMYVSDKTALETMLDIFYTPEE